MNNSAFISYRRDVSSFMARAVFQDLRSHGYDVFMDVESIDSGQFDRIILNQIAARPYFLLILTPGTLDNCNEPGDWVRREIEHAIDLERIIIPLLTPNFSFSTVQPLLAGKLAELPRFNGIEIPHSFFEEAMERLRKRFLKPIDIPLKPTPKSDQAAVQHKVASADAESEITDDQLSAQDYLERAIARPDDNLDKKLEDFASAIDLDPNFADAYYNRGIVYVRNRNFKEAIDDFNEAIRLNSRHDKAYYERGMLRGNLKEAIADYSQAIKINSQLVAAYVRRGFDRKSNGDVDGAIDDFERVLELQPNHAMPTHSRIFSSLSKPMTFWIKKAHLMRWAKN